MKHPILKLALPMLLLFFIAGCGQGAKNSSQKESAPESSPAAQSTSSIPDLPAKVGWPAELTPAELPEYTAGTVTATAVDGDGVLTIKVTDTNKSELYAYIGTLQSTGWIVASNDTQAEAILGLYKVTFALQGVDDSVLQIDVYTEEAGSWPTDEIPPDVPTPGKGVLVGKVEVLSPTENTWYFNYTYDGIDDAAAQAYMNSLTEKGWSGDASQMYKAFEWKGKHYEATIEIYETTNTRTTFTCNFYLSTTKPDPEAATARPTDTDSSVVGSWTLGMLSGGQFSASTGKYEGGTTGLGMVYTFKPDGTYTALAIWSEVIWLTGKYSVADGVLTLTDRTTEESSDDGKTWSTKEVLPDASAYFTVGTDETGKYLLLGEEGAAPPLVEKKNAMKYRPKD